MEEQGSREGPEQHAGPQERRFALAWNSYAFLKGQLTQSGRADRMRFFWVSQKCGTQSYLQAFAESNHVAQLGMTPQLGTGQGGI